MGSRSVRYRTLAGMGHVVRLRCLKRWCSSILESHPSSWLEIHVQAVSLTKSFLCCFNIGYTKCTSLYVIERICMFYARKTYHAAANKKSLPLFLLRMVSTVTERKS
jgi:hypothetical protein